MFLCSARRLAGASEVSHLYPEQSNIKNRKGKMVLLKVVQTRKCWMVRLIITVGGTFHYEWGSCLHTYTVAPFPFFFPKFKH